MKYLINTANFIKISRKVFVANRENGSYHRYVKSLASDLIQQTEGTDSGRIEPKIFRKIRWYMVSTLFIGELLAELTGHELTENEKRAFICLGAAGGLCDILIDEYKYEKVKMIGLLHQTIAPETPSVDKIFLLYLRHLMELTEPRKRALMTKYLEMLVHWQAESLKQFSPGVSEEEVNVITLGKGGASLLLCGVILPVEQEALYQPLYQLGGFIQLMNDSQDMFKDRKEGVYTFISFKNSYKEIFDELESKRQECFEAFSKLKYPPRKLSNFLFGFYAMYIGIVYKLSRYSKLTNGKLNAPGHHTLLRKPVRVNPFTLASFLYCFPKIIQFGTGHTDPSEDLFGEEGL